MAAEDTSVICMVPVPWRSIGALSPDYLPRTRRTENRSRLTRVEEIQLGTIGRALMDAAELVVTGHNIARSDRYRAHLAAKLAELEHLDRKVVRYDVDLSREPNPRQSRSAYRVVVTSRGSGPAVRVEASGTGLHAVLDDALGKLEGRLRRAHDRRVRRHSRIGRTTTDPART
jgi:ribosomal subunit interface protein